MDVNIAVEKKDIAQKLEEIAFERAQFLGGIAILFFLVWAVFDYLATKEVWLHFLKIRGTFALGALLLLLIGSFFRLPSTIINSYVFIGGTTASIYFIHVANQQALPIYISEYAIIYLGCSLGAVWSARYTDLILLVNVLLGGIVYYFIGRATLQEMFVQGGFLIASTWLIGNLLAKYYYQNEHKKVQTALASDKAKKYLYEVNATLEKQKKDIETQQQEIKAQNEELAAQNQQIVEQNDILASAYKHITDSVHYAKRIQEAVLGNPTHIQAQFKDAFILYKPKDIVSGDFYWFTRVTIPVINPQDPQEEIAVKSLKVLVAADCTGHGVPGAFMTVLGSDLLQEIVNREKITAPAAILRELDQRVVAVLNKEGVDNPTNDGMDIAILTIDEPNDILYYAGAKSTLWHVHRTELHQINASPFSIGGTWGDVEKTFQQHTLKISRNDMFYLCSDGYQDQFGGSKGKKLLKKRLRTILQKINSFEAHEQQVKLERRLAEWQGDYEQTDDILVMGIRF